MNGIDVNMLLCKLFSRFYDARHHFPHLNHNSVFFLDICQEAFVMCYSNKLFLKEQIFSLTLLNKRRASN